MENDHSELSLYPGLKAVDSVETVETLQQNESKKRRVTVNKDGFKTARVSKKSPVTVSLGFNSFDDNN